MPVDRPNRLPRAARAGWRPQTMSSAVHPRKRSRFTRWLQNIRSRPGPLQQVWEGRQPPRAGRIKGGGPASTNGPCHQEDGLPTKKASPRRKSLSPERWLVAGRTAGHQRQACHQTNGLRQSSAYPPRSVLKRTAGPPPPDPGREPKRGPLPPNEGLSQRRFAVGGLFRRRVSKKAGLP